MEAQRLGLAAYGGDLNPVAVLICKALVEIPPRFAGLPPVNPDARAESGLKTWERAQGLAEDIGFYGQWMRDRAFKRIGHLYPKVTLPTGEGGGEADVIAWLWARTVRSPDPSWGGHVPLVRSWIVRKAMRGRPAVWVEPVVDRSTRTVSYRIREGGNPPPPRDDRTTGRDLSDDRNPDRVQLHPRAGPPGADGPATDRGGCRRQTAWPRLFSSYPTTSDT